MEQRPFMIPPGAPDGTYFSEDELQSMRICSDQTGVKLEIADVSGEASIIDTYYCRTRSPEGDSGSIQIRCPKDQHPISGCNTIFTSTPDREGLVDCPHCGIWFKAEDHRI